MKLSDIKKQKHLLHVFIVIILLGVMLTMNSYFGEELLLSSNEDELKPQQDYLMITEEAEETNDLVEDITNAEKVENETAIKVEKTKDAAKEETANATTTIETNTNPPTASEVDRTPISGNQYIVKANDTLFYIAQRANVSIQNLKSINNLETDTIVAGQVLSLKETNTSTTTTTTTTTEVASRGNREDDLYWLSRIIHAEAQGESYVGKVAVGNVVLNRVKDGNFPNSIYGVVFDVQHGFTQFSPVLDGSIYNTPHIDSINAAKDALRGERPVGDALYFLNPRKATSFWIVQNRKFFKTIGDHDFYH